MALPSSTWLVLALHGSSWLILALHGSSWLDRLTGYSGRRATDVFYPNHLALGQCPSLRVTQTRRSLVRAENEVLAV